MLMVTMYCLILFAWLHVHMYALTHVRIYKVFNVQLCIIYSFRLCMHVISIGPNTWVRAQPSHGVLVSQIFQFGVQFPPFPPWRGVPNAANCQVPLQRLWTPKSCLAADWWFRSCWLVDVWCLVAGQDWWLRKKHRAWLLLVIDDCWWWLMAGYW